MTIKPECMPAIRKVYGRRQAEHMQRLRDADCDHYRARVRCIGGGSYRNRVQIGRVYEVWSADLDRNEMTVSVPDPHDEFGGTVGMLATDLEPATELTEAEKQIGAGI